MPKPARKRKVAILKLPMQRQFAFADKGQYFNLTRVFEKLNARYFGNRLRGYQIVWGRKHRQRPKDSIVFGTIQEEDRMIRIHPLLDQAWVPGWFLQYVVYHEMLHAVVPDKWDANGRRRVHHEKFLAREREYFWFRRAKAWEEENLARFLR